MLLPLPLFFAPQAIALTLRACRALVTNLPVWSQNSLHFRLTVTTSGAHPCPNRCSNHGTCRADGTCACAPGWGDSDCSHTIQPIALETTLSTRLHVDEWQYFYIDPLAGGKSADEESYIFADMEITSDPVNFLPWWPDLFFSLSVPFLPVSCANERPSGNSITALCVRVCVFACVRARARARVCVPDVFTALRCFALL